MGTLQIVKALAQGPDGDTTTATHALRNTLADTHIGNSRVPVGDEDLSEISEGKNDLLDFADSSDFGEKFTSSVQGGSEIDEPFKVTET